MTSRDITKITVLCKTKDGKYFAASTEDTMFIRYAANVMDFIEIDGKFVGSVDAEKIMKQNTDEKEKNTKLF